MVCTNGIAGGPGSSRPTALPIEHRPANNHRTDRRRVKDAAPYGGDGHSFDIQSAAVRGCNEYEVLGGSLVDGSINTHQPRAARYVLPTTTAQTANTTPVLRDVRRAGKIFSYTVHGAFFFIFEKEWGAHPPHRDRCKTTGRAMPALTEWWAEIPGAPPQKKFMYTNPSLCGILYQVKPRGGKLPR